MRKVNVWERFGVPTVEDMTRDHQDLNLESLGCVAFRWKNTNSRKTEPYGCA